MNPENLKPEIEDALRAERPRRRASPGFSERVIDALPSGPIKPSSAPAVERPLWPRLGWAGAFAALTFLVWFQFTPTPSGENAQVAQHDPAVALPASLQLPPVTVEQVQALTARIDDPLEKELKLVLSDTRNAIRFVASNFLPED